VTTRLLYPYEEAWEALGIKRSMFYELVAAGKIRPVRIGRRALIPHEELERYVASLNSAGASGTRG
jgi:excisionase family DNA binding protein